MTEPTIYTAAMLAIGDELLSGRTKDKNIGHLADILTLSGIDLKEVRIVADEEDDIVAALNALRARYTYVFTSGGIGPTHDDITADAVSKAFGVACIHDAKAMEILAAMYERRGMELPRRGSAWPACRRAAFTSTILSPQRRAFISAMSM